MGVPWPGRAEAEAWFAWRRRAEFRGGVVVEVKAWGKEVLGEVAEAPGLAWGEVKWEAPAWWKLGRGEVLGEAPAWCTSWGEVKSWGKRLAWPGEAPGCSAVGKWSESRVKGLKLVPAWGSGSRQGCSSCCSPPPLPEAPSLPPSLSFCLARRASPRRSERHSSLASALALERTPALRPPEQPPRCS